MDSFKFDNMTQAERDNMAQEDCYELFGLLIDATEDFLEEKEVAPEDLPNDERDSDSDVIIYGSDYDDLANQFSEVLEIERDVPEEDLSMNV